MPKVPFDYLSKENILSYEELFSFVKIFIDNGGKKIRITGGEPLVRKDVHRFIKMISDYKNDIDIALTTNGFFLEKYANDLFQAGLKRLNISLDTLNSDRARMLAQKDVLQQVLKGIDEAIKFEFKVKINCVALKNINDDELCDIIDYCKARMIQVRFIEFMENSYAYGDLKGMRSFEILDKILSRYNYIKLQNDSNSPTNLYMLDDGYVFGVIEPHRHDFCGSCNRIRLTAEGFLIPCLYFDEAVDIKKALKNKDMDKALQIFKKVLLNKPEKNKWSNEVISDRGFFQTGG